MHSLEGSSDLDGTIVYSSSSSDSGSFLEEGIKNSENEVNKQWEAIERTLYQEPGQHVTDPELLKECKLWRDTFPHFRVKGTKIDVKKYEIIEEQPDKSIQTIENHLNLTKLNEKREGIKKKVVGELVERLITKFGVHKEGLNNTDLDEDSSSTVKITEIHEEPKQNEGSSMKKSSCKDLDLVNQDEKNDKIQSRTSSAEKESYFERGKLLEEIDNIHKDLLTEKNSEDELCEMFDSWERDFIDDSLKKKLNPTTQSLESLNYDSAIMVNCTMKNAGLKFSNKSPSTRLKGSRFTPPSDSISSVIKPFDITSKIEKKYEGLLGRILEKAHNNDVDPMRNCRTSVSRMGTKSYEESLERTGSGFDDYLKRNKKLPKINKFNNNWLDRGEANLCNRTMENEVPYRPLKNPRGTPSVKKTSSDFNTYNENMGRLMMEENFVEEIRREFMNNYKRPAKKKDVIENINTNRPKPFLNQGAFGGTTQKSSSFGDLPKKNKIIKSRQLKNGVNTVKNDSGLKNRTKLTKTNHLYDNKNNSNGKKNGILPPIESGIICTELSGRCKVGPKIPPKRY